MSPNQDKRLWRGHLNEKGRLLFGEKPETEVLYTVLLDDPVHTKDIWRASDGAHLAHTRLREDVIIREENTP